MRKKYIHNIYKWLGIVHNEDTIVYYIIEFSCTVINKNTQKSKTTKIVLIIHGIHCRR